MFDFRDQVGINGWVHGTTAVGVRMMSTFPA
jgi:hypothetical protein